jgi:hypothetical protein
MNTLIYIALILISFALPALMYFKLGITLPYWHWAVGMISGTVLGYMDCMLFGERQKPKPVSTDEVVIDMPDSVCGGCLYWVDHKCWYQYRRCIGEPICNYRPKRLLERSDK